MVPLLVILIGVIAALLNDRGINASPLVLGSHLSVPVPEWFLQQPPLTQLTMLVCLALMLTVGFSICAWLHRRGADSRSRAVTIKLHRDVMNSSIQRAEIEGVAAQRARAQQLIEQRLPLLARGLSLWWRSWPRNWALLIGCVSLALATNVPLASLAVISGILVWQLYQSLKKSIENDSSTWETPRARRRLVQLISQAPLVLRTQAATGASQSFERELESLYRRVEQQQNLRGRLWPMVFLATAAAVCVLILGLGVNLFDGASRLSLPAALVLAFALTAAVYASMRIMDSIRATAAGDDAALAVYQFLSITDDSLPSEQRVGIAGLRECVSLVDVGLQSGSGETVLSHVSMQLAPGTMVALLGTNPVSQYALAELLLGIGRASQGRLMIDGISMRDIHPRSLVKQVLWVGADGPVFEGSVMENVIAGHSNVDPHDVMVVCQRIGIYDTLTRLSEGLQTVLSINDSRLTPEDRYSIGVARALLHKPPIVVVEEPPYEADELASDRCLEAFKHLVSERSLVLILPRRLETLRQADRVILLNGPRLAGEGTHHELLQTSELYRHLNYQLFNPYRSLV